MRDFSLFSSRAISSEGSLNFFQVELKREYKFRNSGRTYNGVPIMAANMDTTGTFEIAKCFAEHGMFVCIHKHYSIDEWKTFAKNNKVDFYHSLE